MTEAGAPLAATNEAIRPWNRAVAGLAPPMTPDSPRRTFLLPLRVSHSSPSSSPRAEPPGFASHRDQPRVSASADSSACMLSTRKVRNSWASCCSRRWSPPVQFRGAKTATMSASMPGTKGAPPASREAAPVSPLDGGLPPAGGGGGASFLPTSVGPGGERADVPGFPSPPRGCSSPASSARAASVGYTLLGSDSAPSRASPESRLQNAGLASSACTVALAKQRLPGFSRPRGSYRVAAEATQSLLAKSCCSRVEAAGSFDPVACAGWSAPASEGVGPVRSIAGAAASWPGSASTGTVRGVVAPPAGLLLCSFPAPGAGAAWCGVG